MRKTTIGLTYYSLWSRRRGKPSAGWRERRILSDDHVTCTVTEFTSSECFPLNLQLFCAICPERCQIWIDGEPPRGQPNAASENPREIPARNEGLTMKLVVAIIKPFKLDE